MDEGESEIVELFFPNNKERVPVPLNITSQVEIVSSCFQADATRTVGEDTAILDSQYNDLPKSLRGQRTEEETVWSAAKKNLAQMYKKPFTPAEMKNTLILGTNGAFCMALRGNHIFEYKSMLEQYELECLRISFAGEMRRMVHTRGQAQEKVVEYKTISDQDPILEPILKPFIKRLEKLCKKLPEGDPILVADVEKRPDEADGGMTTETMNCDTPPTLVGIDEQQNASTAGKHNLSVDGTQSPSTIVVDGKQNPSVDGEEYTIWMCNSAKGCEISPKNCQSSYAGDEWHPSAIKVRSRMIPVVAFNETHMVILANAVDFSVYKFRSNNRFPERPHARYKILTFADQPDSMINMTLSSLGVCCISAGTMIMIFNITKEETTPVVVETTKEDTTPVIVETTKEDTTPVIVETTKEETTPVVVETTTKEETTPVVVEANGGWGDCVTVELKTPNCVRNISCARVCHIPDDPNDNGLLTFGTSMGECMVVNWKHGNIVTSARSPVAEPVFDSYYSNGRLINMSARNVWGYFTPMFDSDFTFLKHSRLLAVAVCGQLIFALEKYGAIPIWGCSLRNHMFPFKPPKNREFGRRLENQQHAYPGFNVTHNRITIVYPNGLVRIFQLAPKLSREIENMSREAAGATTTSIFHETLIKEKEDKKKRREAKKLEARKRAPKTTTAKKK